MLKNKVLCQALFLSFLTLMFSFAMLAGINYILTGSMIDF